LRFLGNKFSGFDCLIVQIFEVSGFQGIRVSRRIQIMRFLEFMILKFKFELSRCLRIKNITKIP
jgi:hypothetical protein